MHMHALAMLLSKTAQLKNEKLGQTTLSSVLTRCSIKSVWHRISSFGRISWTFLWHTLHKDSFFIKLHKTSFLLGRDKRHQCVLFTFGPLNMTLTDENPNFPQWMLPIFSGCRQSRARPAAVVHQQVNPSPGQRRRRHPGVNVTKLFTTV